MPLYLWWEARLCGYAGFPGRDVIVEAANEDHARARAVYHYVESLIMDKIEQTPEILHGPVVLRSEILCSPAPDEEEE